MANKTIFLPLTSEQLDFLIGLLETPNVTVPVIYAEKAADLYNTIKSLSSKSKPDKE